MHPSQICHVTARGYGRQPVFADDQDRCAFLSLLAEVSDRFAWTCLTYCLMENHYHLLVRTDGPALSAGMQRLNGSHAQRFNRRHDRSGHLFQGRYDPQPIRRDTHLKEAIRYIANNPVRAELVLRPEDWSWSAHRALSGLASTRLVATAETLAFFDADAARAQRTYRAFVDGSLVPGNVRATGIADADPPPVRPSLPALLAAHGADEAMRRAHREHAYTLREIASAVGCHYSTVSRRLRATQRA